MDVYKGTKNNIKPNFLLTWNSFNNLCQRHKEHKLKWHGVF